MHIEHGSWHGPILDYYNMAFCELLAMQRPITDFEFLGMTQADLWKTYPKPISLEQGIFDRFRGLSITSGPLKFFITDNFDGA